MDPLEPPNLDEDSESFDGYTTWEVGVSEFSSEHPLAQTFCGDRNFHTPPYVTFTLRHMFAPTTKPQQCTNTITQMRQITTEGLARESRQFCQKSAQIPHRVHAE